MKDRLCSVLVAMVVLLSLVACGKRADIDNLSPDTNTVDTKSEISDGGNWSSMRGGNYAKILYEDFGIERSTAIDIGEALDVYSCDVDEIYEVTEDGKDGYYISYKDKAGNKWDKQHVIKSEDNPWIWLVDE